MESLARWNLRLAHDNTFLSCAAARCEPMRPFLYRRPHRTLRSLTQQSAAPLSHAHSLALHPDHRNAIIATVAGAATLQFRKGEGRPPLAATGLLMMGGLYMYVGSTLYLWQVFKLRRGMRLGPKAIAWSVFNACWPSVLWSHSLLCLLDESASRRASNRSTSVPPCDVTRPPHRRMIVT